MERSLPHRRLASMAISTLILRPTQSSARGSRATGRREFPFRGRQAQPERPAQPDHQELQERVARSVHRELRERLAQSDHRELRDRLDRKDLKECKEYKEYKE